MHDTASAHAWTVRLVHPTGIFVQIALGAGIILAAARHKVPVFQLARMVATLAAGSAVGAVPLLGSFTRTAYTANQKNLRLLEKYVDPKQVRGPVKDYP